MRKVIIKLVIAAFVVAIFPIMAHATFVELNEEFSGADDPKGMAPWVTVDIGNPVSGVITLTMDAGNLVGTEFVSELSLNFDPALDLTKLLFSHISGANTNPSGTVNTGLNAFKADGDGFFDIQFKYANGAFGADPGVNVYTTSVWEISSSQPLLMPISMSSFIFGSVGGDKGSFIAAAHVQSIDVVAGDGLGDGSGWIGASVPEPSLELLLGISLVGLVGVGTVRKIKQKKVVKVKT